MIGIIIIVGFMVGMGIIASGLRPVVETPKNDCPPHVWEYTEGLGHTCALCKFKAGSHTTSGGDYGG